MRTSGIILAALLVLPAVTPVAAGTPDQQSSVSTIGVREVTATPLDQGTVFVAPDGKGDGRSASAPCSLENLDLYKGKLKVAPGDVVFFRGGVYEFSMDGARRVYLAGGTKEQPVVYESYPGEMAVFDGSSLSTGDTDTEAWREGRLHLRGEYAILRKVEVRRMPTYGIRIHGNHNTVQGCRIHDNHLSGLGIANITDGYSTKDSGGSYNVVSDNIIYNNSDVGLKHHNYGDGDNADGVILHSGVGNLISHNTVYGNSDDGIDTWRSMDSVVQYNLVHSHGKGPRGNGNGIKLGGADEDSPLGANAIAKHNICHSNTRIGFNVNGGKRVSIKYNTAYNNGDFGYALMKDTVVIGNLSVEDQSGPVGWSKGKTQQGNSWQKEGAIEFRSTNSDSVDFLKPVKGTDFENTGAYAMSK